MLALRSPRSKSKRFVARCFVVALGVWLCSLAYAQPTFKYETTSDWQQGFNGQITIGNTSAQSLTQWSLDFDFDRSIDVIWNATIVSHTGNHYRLQSAGWNDEIPANGSVSF